MEALREALLRALEAEVADPQGDFGLILEKYLAAREAQPQSAAVEALVEALFMPGSSFLTRLKAYLDQRDADMLAEYTKALRVS